MKFHEISMVGKYYIEELSSLPTWTINDKRRFIYINGILYYGGETEWIKINLEEDFNNHINDTYIDNVHGIDTIDKTDTDIEKNKLVSNNDIKLLEDHRLNINNPHNITTAQLSATSEEDFNNHINDTEDPHNTLDYFNNAWGVYSRYLDGNTAEIPASESGSGNWFTIEFDNLNKNESSPVTFSGNQFILPSGYIYQISYEAMVYKGDSTAGATPNYIIAMRIINGDTSQTLNYGGGEGGSAGTPVVIGSRTDTEWEHNSSLSNIHYSTSFTLAPNQNTTVELSASLHSSSCSMYCQRPSIHIMSFKIL